MKQPLLEITLKRTGEMVPFDSLTTADIFYCDGLFWSKTSYKRDLNLGGARHLHSENSLDKYGFCAFGGEGYEMVEKVELVQKPILGGT